MSFVKFGEFLALVFQILSVPFSPFLLDSNDTNVGSFIIAALVPDRGCFPFFPPEYFLSVVLIR